MTMKQKKHKAITDLKAYRENPALRSVKHYGFTIVFTLAEIANDIANGYADSYEEYMEISEYLEKYV